MTDMQVKYANYLLEQEKLSEAQRKREGDEIQRDLENFAKYGPYKYTMMTGEANRTVGNLGKDGQNLAYTPGTTRQDQNPNSWRQIGYVGDTVGGIVDMLFPFFKALGG